jgi:hypothetical protein
MKKQIHLVNRLSGLMKPLKVLAILILYSNTNILLSQNWDEVVKAVASDRAAND